MGIAIIILKIINYHPLKNSLGLTTKAFPAVAGVNVLPILRESPAT